MPTPTLSEEMMQKTLDLVEEHGSVGRAARIEGISENTLRHRHKKAVAWKEGHAPDIDIKPLLVEFPNFPEDDLPAEKILDYMESRYEKRRASFDAHTWFDITIHDKKPIAILWFGDPHIDSDGCNVPLIRKHCKLCEDTPGLYGANIGDTTNNWAGRLIKLYADQNASLKTARILAEWFMLESGVTWLIWLIGNHDAWGDGAEILARMAQKHRTQKVIMHDWETRFSLVFPNGWKPRIFAAHDLKGHSQWNPLHGPMKEGQMGEQANLYVVGHKHNYAMFTWENPKRGMHQTFVRVRGYKEMDDYTRRLGFGEQKTGSAVLTVFDQDDETITPFVDIEKGVAFLRTLRGE